MKQRSKTVAVIGECMLELSLNDAVAGTTIPSSMSYGGDTLNTAVYLSRLDTSVDYLTALGSDALSDWMIGRWESEGVGCSSVERFSESPPGLYVIQTDEQGERSFLYWRENSPVRQLLSSPQTAVSLFERIHGYDTLYLSGISLSLCSPSVRELLYKTIADFRANGGQLFFDINYRARLWPDPIEAIAEHETIYRLTDIALSGLDDELELFQDESEQAVIDRLQSFGIAEIALKKGLDGCLVVTGLDRELTPAEPAYAVDTTAAGDSFNGAYLAARIKGDSPVQAARAAHRLAAVVVQHRGAIIPLQAMPA